jgi:hypothetical protein
MLAVAQTSFDVRQNRCTKELCIVPHPGRQSTKTVYAGRRPNNGNQAFCSELSGIFELEEWFPMQLKPNHGGTRNKTMTHRQLINV